MKKVARIPIRVVYYRDHEDKSIWIAHCLEFDLIGDGGDQQEAMKMLGQAIMVQLESALKSGSFKNLFTSAPAEYQMKYAKGRDIANAELKIEVHVDDYEIDNSENREYDDGYAGCDSKELAFA